MVVSNETMESFLGHHLFPRLSHFPNLFQPINNLNSLTTPIVSIRPLQRLLFRLLVSFVFFPTEALRHTHTQFLSAILAAGVFANTFGSLSSQDSFSVFTLAACFLSSCGKSTFPQNTPGGSSTTTSSP